MSYFTATHVVSEGSFQRVLKYETQGRGDRMTIIEKLMKKENRNHKHDTGVLRTRAMPSRVYDTWQCSLL